MQKNSELPIIGKAIRFSPGREMEPGSSFWKVWSEGNEIYASARSPGGMAKISVHESGRIHYRLEGKLKQDLAPVMQVGSGPWLHAFELRFLLSDGANVPFGERDTLKKKSAYLIPVPPGFVLHANLIVGQPGTPLDCPLPMEFLPAGQALWRTRLRDGRPAVLVARTLEMDDQNRDQIKHFREDLTPTVTFSEMPTGRKYCEIYNLHWSAEGGNVVLVVPMGDEGFRAERESASPNPLGKVAPAREFRFRSAHSSTQVSAPDGSVVAVAEVADVDTNLQLTKGDAANYDVGQVQLVIAAQQLIPGSKFFTAPSRLVCHPNLNGSGPRTWEYLVFSRFDGFVFQVEIRQLSTAMRNKNLQSPMEHLGDDEELVMTIPNATLTLSATLDAPVASSSLSARFLLRSTK